MVKKRKLGTKIIMVILGVLLLLTPFAGCAAEAEEKTIIMAELDWDSVNLHTHIAAFILEHGYGYEIEYVYGAEQPIAAGLIAGDVEVLMEGWMDNYPEIYDPALEEGTLISAGTNFADSTQGWWVPRYVVEGDAERGIEPMAPGLKALSDLPQYWEVFKDPEVPTKGRIYNCIPGWTCGEFNQIKLVSEGLDDYYVMFNPGTGYALAASMRGAYEKGKPWLGYYWEPSYELGILDMYRLEDEPYDEEVWNTDYSCGFPVAPVEILINAEFAEREPVVVDFLRQYETTSELVNAMLAYLKTNEVEHKQAAIWFLQEYESLWTEWVSEDVASKVKAALD